MIITAPQRPPPPTLYRPDGLEMQLETAHRFKRDVRAFLAEALTLATLDEEIARSCIYAVWRDGRIVVGPSVRLAEIVASSYGNLDVSTEVLPVEDEGAFVSHGIAWDLERNVRRRASGGAGNAGAATSIAYRNAVFDVVPRAYIDSIFGKVLAFAVGDASTLVARREALVARFAALGVKVDQLLARVQKASVEDVGVAELALLIGLETSVRSGEVSLGEMFPEAEDVEAEALEAELRAEPIPKVDPPAPVNESHVYITNAKVDPPPPPPVLDPTPPPATRAPRRPKAAPAEPPPSPSPEREPVPSASAAGPPPPGFPPCVRCGNTLDANSAVKAPDGWRHVACMVPPYAPAPVPASAAADALFGKAPAPVSAHVCVVCKKPMGDDCVPTMGGVRHPTCSPMFGGPAPEPDDGPRRTT